jgi:protein-ribulosamine 3-kinase
MDSWQGIELAISEAVGAPFAIASRAAIGGGSISSAFRVDGNGRSYFVKTRAPDQADMFAAEAAGLEEIARARAVRAPRPVCHGTSRSASWIVLEHLQLRPVNSTGMRVLGENLARLHRVTRERYGWDRDNTIGATPQPNAWADDWIAFWRERRLGYQLERAASKDRGGRPMTGGDRLLEELPALFAGYRPRPSLLHGDLWSGNAAMTAQGEPVIYDPAVYFGDRETDLAMTELFGGFSQPFYDAYRAQYPLDPGYETRKPLYNLYHVLNHFNLFGGGYGAQAERMIVQLLAQL